MAMLGDFGDDYTRTGKGALTRWSNGLSFLPRLIKFTSLEKIPVIGGTLTAVLGYADTIWESARWLFRGEFGSAATVAITGTIGTAVNVMADSPVFWWVNAVSGVTTGTSIGTHARAATEAVISGVTGSLGATPTVLKSNFASIGSIARSMQQSGPGKFTSGVSAQRGENADAAYQRYMAGEGGVHVNQLQSAYARGA